MYLGNMLDFVERLNNYTSYNYKVRVRLVNGSRGFGKGYRLVKYVEVDNNTSTSYTEIEDTEQFEDEVINIVNDYLKRHRHV